jgi:hypothetical protein
MGFPERADRVLGAGEHHLGRRHVGEGADILTRHMEIDDGGTRCGHYSKL